MKVLFISPHTDDVELGAGGTLIKLLEQGNDLFWVVLSTAEESLPEGADKDMLKSEFINVAKAIGLKEDHYKICGYRVRYLPHHRQEILDELVSIKKRFSPGLVIGPSMNDHHQDHQVVANEMIRAYKNSASIICYELPWNHIEFNTQMFFKLNRSHLDQKIQLLMNYKSQISLHRSYFSSEFISGWAKMRGTQVDSEYAEAFEVVRWIA